MDPSRSATGSQCAGPRRTLSGVGHRLAGIVGIGDDIVERKQSHRELRVWGILVIEGCTHNSMPFGAENLTQMELKSENGLR